METKLSKNADALICLLYKEYCDKRNKGASIVDSANFGGLEQFQNIASKLSPEDIVVTCRELGRNGLVDIEDADDSIYLMSLSDNGIIYMENRFKNGVADVLDYLGKIKGVIPFL